MLPDTMMRLCVGGLCRQLQAARHIPRHAKPRRRTLAKLLRRRTFYSQKFDGPQLVNASNSVYSVSSASLVRSLCPPPGAPQTYAKHTSCAFDRGSSAQRDSGRRTTCDAKALVSQHVVGA